MPSQSTTQIRARRMFAALIVLVVLSLCLQVVGFASPGWVIIMYGFAVNEVNINIGLWAVNYCFGGKCKTESIDDVIDAVKTLNILKNGLTEYRVETSLALAFIVLVLIACLFIRRPGQTMIVSIAVILLTLCSGILALVASGKLGDDTRKVHDLLDEFSPFLFPYSLFLTGLGGIFALIATLVVLLGVRPCNSDSEPTPAYPMATQPGYASRQPHVAQPQVAQQYVAQPYVVQSYAGQQYVTQPYAGRQYMAAHPYLGQPNVGQSYSGSGHSRGLLNMYNKFSSQMTELSDQGLLFS